MKVGHSYNYNQEVVILHLPDGKLIDITREDLIRMIQVLDAGPENQPPNTGVTASWGPRPQRITMPTPFSPDKFFLVLTRHQDDKFLVQKYQPHGEKGVNPLTVLAQISLHDEATFNKLVESLGLTEDPVWHFRDDGTLISQQL